MITVVGRRDGSDVVSFVLDHGADPRAGLAARGWEAGDVTAEGVRDTLVLAYDVVATGPTPAPDATTGPGLSAAERAGVVPRQRIAAYAVVVDEDRLLLTRLSTRTEAEGRWTLPGGGLDPDETAAEAVLREVHEETGQQVVDLRLLGVLTQHWVGRSGRGAEDHHAVRLVHAARCPDPTPPVVHDVGGSTSEAQWVPLADLGRFELVPTVAWSLAVAGLERPHRPAQS